MKCAIMQPGYLSWMGDFYLMDVVDKYVFLDTVQLVKRGWDVRNRIKTAQGEHMLTLPIIKSASRDETTLATAHIAEFTKTKKKHLRTIEMSYKKAEGFDEVFPVFSKMYEFDGDGLIDFNTHIIKTLVSEMGIEVSFSKASELDNITGEKDERLLSICNRLDCKTYVSPVGSADYINRHQLGGVFSDSDVNLIYRYYQCREYKQLHKAFIPNLSIVDVVFNNGFKKALSIIRSANIALLTPQELLDRDG